MITSVKYIKDEKGNDSIVRVIYNNDTSVKITVQVNNVGNTDWDNILQWVADGNTITESD
tara:strand:- start:1190 stop:1369 length:180 start_codon:yes stop_codon:yes gene_type:complete